MRRFFSSLAVLTSFMLVAELHSAEPEKKPAEKSAAPPQAKETKSAKPAKDAPKSTVSTKPVAPAEPEKAAEPKRTVNPNADPFDAQTLDGWMTQDGKPVSAGWEIVDGAIHLNKASKVRAGNIITTKEYGDFDLSFEWKIAVKGNSGIKYRVRSYNGKVLGCEYQVYDDVGTKTSLKSKNSAASLYDLFEPSDAKKLKPAGEYNTARIVVKGQHIEHWLNGAKVVDVTVGNAEWKKRVADSKFNEVRKFSEWPGGRLMLTDHGSEVWYRNFKFIASPAPPPPPKPEPQLVTMTYKTVDDLKIQADVEFTDDGGKHPVVVWIHGGALINGHRASVPQWVRDAFVPRGYAVVSLDYRLAPESKLPQIVGDVEDAFRWIRKSGPKLFGADPERIAIIGGSAGGYLTFVAGQRVNPKPQALVSLWGYGDLGAQWTFEASKHERHNQTEFATEDASKIVAGPAVADARERKTEAGPYYQWLRRTGGWAEAVTGWKPQRDAKKFAPYMPEKNVTSDYPPTFMIHGDADTDVPFACSERMAEQFKKVKVEHRLIRFEGAEHGLPGVDPKKVAEAYDAATKFVIQHLERK